MCTECCDKLQRLITIFIHWAMATEGQFYKIHKFTFHEVVSNTFQASWVKKVGAKNRKLQISNKNIMGTQNFNFASFPRNGDFEPELLHLRTKTLRQIENFPTAQNFVERANGHDTLLKVNASCTNHRHVPGLYGILLLADTWTRMCITLTINNLPNVICSITSWTCDLTITILTPCHRASQYMPSNIIIILFFNI